MSCGCGGECCKQSVAGLGVIPRFPVLPPNIRRGRMVRGLGFFYTGDGAGAGYNDYSYYIEGGDQEADWDALYYEAAWGIPYDYWNGYSTGGNNNWQGLLDWWEQLTTGRQGYYDPASDSFVIDAPGANPTTGSTGGNNNWQGLLDWWRDLTGGFTGNAPQPTGGGYDAERGLPGYCRGGTYHPDYDPYICVPFPDETPAERNQRQQAAQRAQAAQKAAAAAKAAQQAAQPCPPNTGLVKNPQGQCVCPNGLAFSKSQGKCVLISQLTAEDKKALEGTDWWKYLAIGAFALIAIKAVK